MPYKKDKYFYYIGDFRRAVVVIQDQNVAIPAETFQKKHAVVRANSSEFGTHFMVFVRPDGPDELEMYMRKKNAIILPECMDHSFVHVSFGFASCEIQNDVAQTQPNGRGFQETVYGRDYDDRQDPNAFTLEF